MYHFHTFRGSEMHDKVVLDYVVVVGYAYLNNNQTPISKWFLWGGGALAKIVETMCDKKIGSNIFIVDKFFKKTYI
jgi:hypothetical protein